MNDYQEILTNYTTNNVNCHYNFKILEDGKDYNLEGKNVVDFYKNYCNNLSHSNNLTCNVLEKINEKS